MFLYRSFLTAFLLISSAWASAQTTDPLRLIETAPNERSWMTEHEIEQLAKSQFERGRHGGFIDVTELGEDYGQLFLQPLGFFEGRKPVQQVAIRGLVPELSAEQLHSNIQQLSNFFNRFYKSESGVAAASWIRDRFQELGKGRSDITVELVQHSFAQPSVIARIPGRGPHSAERVILGAHEDSISWNSGKPPADARAPGADDNASGVSTLLEVFRVLVQSDFQPDRTIEFMAYAGEERGLLGSGDIAKRYRTQNAQVVGVLQLDMTSRPGAARDVGIISDNVDRGLTNFLKTLVDTYVGIPWKESPCGYGCSDHASWTKAGYPSAFPFESSVDEVSSDVHTQFDTIEKLDAAFGLHFAKLALAFAVETSAQ